MCTQWFFVVIVIIQRLPQTWGSLCYRYPYPSGGNALQGLNAFASGRLDAELDEGTPLAYRDAFATRQPSGLLSIVTIHFSFALKSRSM